MITGCQRALVRPHQEPRLRPRADGRGGQPAAGALVAGRYRVLERVGRGATATVWRARDERLDRDVAVKQFAALRQSGTTTGVHGRVDGLAEVRIAARVRHPNVAAVHDVVEQDRSCWLVMEYVAADTLATVLRQRHRLPPPIAAAVGLQLLAALRAVHEAGVVHCDVKPANLLLGDDGRLVLVDFGIAEVAGDTPVARDDGEIVGSPAYMAPELIRGETPGPAADLWSLGTTLYAAVEGRPPFPHRDPAPTLAAVLLDSPEPARRAGPLRPLLEWLLVKDPAARPSHDAVHTLLSAAQPAQPAPSAGAAPLTTPRTDLDTDPTGATRPLSAPAGGTPR